MFEQTRRIAGWVIPAVAIAIIVVGLWPRTAAPVGIEGRALHIAATIKCPFCSGESIAASSSSVAADYRELIEEWVAEGQSDDDIYQRFEERFGEGILLSSGTSGWGLALWILPALALVVGGFAILGLKRARRDPEKVSSDERAIEEPAR